MKLAYGSDLHLEFGLLELENKESADVLVLAGDVMVARDVGVPKYEWFFENCSKEFNDIVYIMGNHEHYDGDISETKHHMRRITDKFPNIHFLENEIVKIDGIFFFGATMWTDCNNRDPYVMRRMIKGMNDFRLIRNGEKPFYPLDSAKIFQNTTDNLKTFLESIGDDEKVVVVTHHSPSKKSIHPMYEIYTDLNYGYYTNLEEFVASYPKIKSWHHGHVHTPFDYYIGGTRILCNPRGYKGQEKQSETFTLKYVEV